MSNITSKSKTEEIAVAFKEQLATGKVFVGSIEVTSNPDYTSVMFLQELTEEPTKENLLALALSWVNKTIIRHWMNFETKNITFAVGDLANDIFSNLSQSEMVVNLKIYENFTPRTWTNAEGVQTSNPKTNPKTGEAIMIEGLPVYRHTDWTFTEACIEKATKEQALEFIANLPLGTEIATQQNPISETVADFANAENNNKF